MHGYVHLIIAIGCLAIIYPKLLHPLIFSHLFSKTKKDGNKISYDKVVHNDGDDLDPQIEQQLHMHAHIRGEGGVAPKVPLNKAEPRNLQIQPKSSNAGTMTILLPVYGAGIAFYLIYTLAKVFGGKSKKYQQKKREFLKEHYRNFHYDVDRKEFRMGVTVPNDLIGMVPADNEDNEDDRAFIFSNDDGIKRPYDDFYSTEDCADRQVDRCALVDNDLDLEKIVQKSADDITDSELICLKQKLAETERNMARILETMHRIESNKSLNSSLNGDAPIVSDHQSVEIPLSDDYPYDDEVEEEDEITDDESELPSDGSDVELPSHSSSLVDIGSDASHYDDNEDDSDVGCDSVDTEDDYCEEDEDVRYRGTTASII